MGGTEEDDRKSHHTGAFDRKSTYSYSGQGKNYRKKEDDCFVASVVYGNETAREVNILREYRDNVLMPSLIGRKFVELYYGGAGKKAANFIEEKARFLIPVIKKGLDYLVRGYEQERNIKELDRK